MGARLGRGKGLQETGDTKVVQRGGGERLPPGKRLRAVLFEAPSCAPTAAVADVP